eukprot:6179699-Pleurochrysis_carterae.AAC.3
MCRCGHQLGRSIPTSRCKFGLEKHRTSPRAKNSAIRPHKQVRPAAIRHSQRLPAAPAGRRPRTAASCMAV